jgi:hypothetical protein
MDMIKSIQSYYIIVSNCALVLAAILERCVIGASARHIAGKCRNEENSGRHLEFVSFGSEDAVNCATGLECKNLNN